MTFKLIIAIVIIFYTFLKVFFREVERRKYRGYENASRIDTNSIGWVVFNTLMALVAILLEAFELSDFSNITLLIIAIPNLFQFLFDGLRVYYDDKELLFRRYYGKIKRISFADVTNCSVRKDLIIETNEKTIRIPSLLVDWEPILARLGEQKKYGSRSKRYTRVRSLKDSVTDIGRFYATLVIGFVLGSVAVIMLVLCITVESEMEGRAIAIATCVFMVVAFYGSIPISIIAVRRHHSSAIWDFIARILINEMYLVPCVKNVKKLLWHLNKGRSIVFIYNGKKYYIQPSEKEPRTLDIEHVLMHGEEELCEGNAEIIIDYEFQPGVSLKNNLKEIEIVHIIKRLYWATVLS